MKWESIRGRCFPRGWQEWNFAKTAPAELRVWDLRSTEESGLAGAGREFKGDRKSCKVLMGRGCFLWGGLFFEKKQPRVLWVCLFISLFSRDCQKSNQNLSQWWNGPGERDFWNNSSMVSLPSPFCVPRDAVFNINISSYSWIIFLFWPHIPSQSSKISTFVHHSRLPGVLTEHLNEEMASLKYCFF